MNTCPKCGAALQENALFCPHCMTRFEAPQAVAAPKITPHKKKRMLTVAIAVLLIIALIGGGAGTYYYKKHAPICTAEQFLEATPVASKKLGLDNLWDAGGFIDARYLSEQKITQYTTETQLDGTLLSVFFYNKGEQVLAYFADVAPADFASAESLIKCIICSACNNYYTDLDRVFSDETLYPKTVISAPFDSFYTDLISRTEQYNADIKSGAAISTKYVEMNDDDFRIAYFITERNASGYTVYDLYLNIMRA